MSRVSIIGDSLATHIESVVSGISAVFEPTEQHPASATATAEVYWLGGNQGTVDGDIIIGGEVDAYTDIFTIAMSRSDGNMDQLIADQAAVSHSLNYDWTETDVDYKRVVSRTVSREAMDDSKKSEVRTVSLNLEVTYRER